MDYNWVTYRLSTGAALNGPDDAQVLVQAGVTHILDVTDAGDDTPLFAALPNIHILWNPTADDGVHPKPVSWFETSLNFALPAFIIPGAKVYTHCSAGVNRGPSTAYLILRALGLSSVAAEALIRTARPQVGLAYKDDADLALQMLGFVLQSS